MTALHPDIIHILHTILFSYWINKENLLDNQELLKLMIISIFHSHDLSIWFKGKTVRKKLEASHW